MNDAEFEVQKARIWKYLDKWLDRLPGRFNVKVYYYRGLIPDVDGTGVHEDSLMRVGVQWEYMKANIHVNLDQAAECDDDYLNLSAAHEVAHILVNELRHTTDDWLKHEERVCCYIADMLVSTEKESGKDGRAD